MFALSLLGWVTVVGVGVACLTLWLGRRDFFPRVKVSLSANRVVGRAYGTRDLAVLIELVSKTRRMVKIKGVGVFAAGPRFRRRRRGRVFAWMAMETNKPLPARLEPGDSCEYWKDAAEFCEDMAGRGLGGVVLFCGYAVDVDDRVHFSKFVEIDFDTLPGEAASASGPRRGPFTV